MSIIQSDEARSRPTRSCVKVYDHIPPRIDDAYQIEVPAFIPPSKSTPKSSVDNVNWYNGTHIVHKCSSEVSSQFKEFLAFSRNLCPQEHRNNEFWTEKLVNTPLESDEIALTFLTKYEYDVEQAKFSIMCHMGQGKDNFGTFLDNEILESIEPTKAFNGTKDKLLSLLRPLLGNFPSSEGQTRDYYASLMQGSNSLKQLNTSTSDEVDKKTRLQDGKKKVLTVLKKVSKVLTTSSVPSIQEVVSILDEAASYGADNSLSVHLPDDLATQLGELLHKLMVCRRWLADVHDMIYKSSQSLQHPSLKDAVLDKLKKLLQQANSLPLHCSEVQQLKKLISETESWIIDARPFVIISTKEVGIIRHYFTQGNLVGLMIGIENNGQKFKLEFLSELLWRASRNPIYLPDKKLLEDLYVEVQKLAINVEAFLDTVETVQFRRARSHKRVNFDDILTLYTLCNACSVEIPRLSELKRQLDLSQAWCKSVREATGTVALKRVEGLIEEGEKLPFNLTTELECLREKRSQARLWLEKLKKSIMPKASRSMRNVESVSTDSKPQLSQVRQMVTEGEQLYEETGNRDLNKAQNLLEAAEEWQTRVKEILAMDMSDDSWLESSDGEQSPTELLEDMLEEAEAMPVVMEEAVLIRAHLKSLEWASKVRPLLAAKKTKLPELVALLQELQRIRGTVHTTMADGTSIGPSTPLPNLREEIQTREAITAAEGWIKQAKRLLQVMQPHTNSVSHGSGSKGGGHVAYTKRFASLELVYTMLDVVPAIHVNMEAEVVPLTVAAVAAEDWLVSYEKDLKLLGISCLSMSLPSFRRKSVLDESSKHINSNGDNDDKKEFEEYPEDETEGLLSEVASSSSNVNSITESELPQPTGSSLARFTAMASAAADLVLGLPEVGLLMSKYDAVQSWLADLEGSCPRRIGLGKRKAGIDARPKLSYLKELYQTGTNFGINLTDELKRITHVVSVVEVWDSKVAAAFESAVDIFSTVSQGYLELVDSGRLGLPFLQGLEKAKSPASATAVVEGGNVRKSGSGHCRQITIINGSVSHKFFISTEEDAETSMESEAEEALWDKIQDLHLRLLQLLKDYEGAVFGAVPENLNLLLLGVGGLRWMETVRDLFLQEDWGDTDRSFLQGLESDMEKYCREIFKDMADRFLYRTPVARTCEDALTSMDSSFVEEVNVKMSYEQSIEQTVVTESRIAYDMSDAWSYTEKTEHMSDQISMEVAVSQEIGLTDGTNMEDGGGDEACGAAVKDEVEKAEGLMEEGDVEGNEEGDEYSTQDILDGEGGDVGGEDEQIANDEAGEDNEEGEAPTEEVLEDVEHAKGGEAVADGEHKKEDNENGDDGVADEEAVDGIGQDESTAGAAADRGESLTVMKEEEEAAFNATRNDKDAPPRKKKKHAVDPTIDLTSRRTRDRPAVNWSERLGMQLGVKGRGRTSTEGNPTAAEPPVAVDLPEAKSVKRKYVRQEVPPKEAVAELKVTVKKGRVVAPTVASAGRGGAVRGGAVAGRGRGRWGNRVPVEAPVPGRKRVLTEVDELPTAANGGSAKKPRPNKSESVTVLATEKKVTTQAPLPPVAVSVLAGTFQEVGLTLPKASKLYPPLEYLCSIWLHLLKILIVSVDDAQEWAVEAQLLIKKSTNAAFGSEDKKCEADVIRLLESASLKKLRVRERKELEDRLLEVEEWSALAFSLQSTRPELDTLKNLVNKGERLLFDRMELEELKRQYSAGKAWVTKLQKLKAVKGGISLLSPAKCQELLTETKSITVDLSVYIDEINQIMRLYCICRQPYSGDMVQCDTCEDWYHLSCVGMTAAQAERCDNYICPRCAILQSFNAAALSVAETVNRWMDVDACLRLRDAKVQKLVRRAQREEKEIQRIVTQINNENEVWKQRMESVQQSDILDAHMIGRQSNFMSNDMEYASFPSASASSLASEAVTHADKVQTLRTELLHVRARLQEALQEESEEQMILKLEYTRKSSIFQWMVFMRSVVWPKSEAERSLGMPRENGISNGIRNATLEADTLGIMNVPDVNMILESFKWMAWCYRALFLLRGPPSTRAARRLVEDAKTIRLADEKTARYVTTLLTKSGVWKGKVRKLFTSVMKTMHKKGVAKTGGVDVDATKAATLVSEGASIPISSRLKQALLDLIDMSNLQSRFVPKTGASMDELLSYSSDEDIPTSSICHNSTVSLAPIPTDIWPVTLKIAAATVPFMHSPSATDSGHIMRPPLVTGSKNVSLHYTGASSYPPLDIIRSPNGSVVGMNHKAVDTVPKRDVGYSSSSCTMNLVTSDRNVIDESVVAVNVASTTVVKAPVNAFGLLTESNGTSEMTVEESIPAPAIP